MLYFFTTYLQSSLNRWFTKEFKTLEYFNMNSRMHEIMNLARVFLNIFPTLLFWIFLDCRLWMKKPTHKHGLSGRKRLGKQVKDGPSSWAKFHIGRITENYKWKINSSTDFMSKIIALLDWSWQCCRLLVGNIFNGSFALLWRKCKFTNKRAQANKHCSK